jgi:hypothetical protein
MFIAAATIYADNCSAGRVPEEAEIRSVLTF